MMTVNQLVRAKLIQTLQTLTQLDTELSLKTKARMDELATDLDTLNKESHTDVSAVLNKDELLTLIKVASCCDKWKFISAETIDEYSFNYDKKRYEPELNDLTLSDAIAIYTFERNTDYRSHSLSLITVKVFSSGLKVIFQSEKSADTLPGLISASTLFNEIQETCDIT